MMYTREEKAKIHENLDKIKAYLEEMCPQLRDKVTVDFGPVKTYANFDREKAYHITVSKDGVYGRTGGLGIDFDKTDKGSSTRATAYEQLDYAVSLIQNWSIVKSTVNNAIKNQKQMLADIDNFEI